MLTHVLCCALSVYLSAIGLGLSVLAPRARVCVCLRRQQGWKEGELRAGCLWAHYSVGQVSRVVDCRGHA